MVPPSRISDRSGASTRRRGARRPLAGRAVAAAALTTSLGLSLVGANSSSASGVAAAPHLVAAAATGALGADTAIACPIPSGSEFIDSWGAGRSGGRRHEGVDMIADRGTPVIAAQSGDVNFKRNRLGGNAAWLTSANGNTFYYAHFDSFEGESRFVLQGDVIGYVGSTGNAQGPHLHFETHFGGSVGNPFDATYAACVQPMVDALNDLAAAEAERLAIHGEVTLTRDDTVLIADEPVVEIDVKIDGAVDTPTEIGFDTDIDTGIGVAVAAELRVELPR